MFLALVICFLVIFPCGCSDSDSNNSDPAVDPATPVPDPYVASGFPQVVVVSGTNYEMGVQYGEQSADAIYHNVTLFKSSLYTAFGSETVDKDMEAWDYYLRKYDPAYPAWIEGISDGCKNKGYNVSYMDLILLMVYPSELWARPNNYPEEFESQYLHTSSSTESPEEYYHSCNSFAATGPATPDGKTIHALDQMAGTDMMNNVILIAFPTDGYGFVGQSFAGRVNANAAMNSNGFAWTMTAIMADESVFGLTEVYFHYLAQYASSTADAVDYIQNTPRGGVSGGFILSDPNKVEVFETSKDVFARRTPNEAGFVVQTNNLVDPSLLEYNPFWLQFMGTYERYNTVYQFLDEAAPGSVDFEFAKSMFASSDWYDAAEGEWHYNEPGSNFISNDHTSICSSIFFPSDLVAYLSTGTPSGNGLPAQATGEYVRVQLASTPKEVTAQANSDALDYYWEAAELYEHELNAMPAYLTTVVIKDIEDKLDEAMTAYSIGIDRAAFADFETDAKQRAALWGEAMTSFAKAQLYSQMAKSTLLKLSK